MSLRVYLFEPRTRGAGGGLWPGCVVSAHPTTHNFAIESKPCEHPMAARKYIFSFFHLSLSHSTLSLRLSISLSLSLSVFCPQIIKRGRFLAFLSVR